MYYFIKKRKNRAIKVIELLNPIVKHCAYIVLQNIDKVNIYIYNPEFDSCKRVKTP